MVNTLVQFCQSRGVEKSLFCANAPKKIWVFKIYVTSEVEFTIADFLKYSP